MSVRSELQAALRAAIAGGAGLEPLSGVFAAPPERAALPHALFDEPVLTDWGAKGMSGREARGTLVIRDAGETPVRLRALADAAEAVLAGTVEAPEGWQIVSLVVLRSRVLREGAGRWAALIDWRARMIGLV